MKRALKKKVKAELENTPGDDVPVGMIDAVHPKVNQCRVPTTAAMIGLAISMGATSLLVTRQSDQATAAEALGNQNRTSTIPTFDVEVKFAATKKLESQAVS
ncbi:MAG: peptidoglycan DD-metalloendopeptidase family protein, partial [Brasilonema sp.]